MDPELARRVHSIFSRACELSPKDRGAFLSQACGDDPSLRSKIDTMLQAMEPSPDFLEKPILEKQIDPPPATNGTEQVGNYCILRQIGSGGMASVYEAQQDHPRRRVAIKMLRTTLLHTSAIERFEYETHALARLQHPHIAQIYEAGTWNRGSESVPFFAMEFVADARSITQFARDEKLGVRAILDLFLKVCDAVQYGHQLGVIHRDLKPMNILVGGSGEPKVIDFGVARSTDPRQAWITASVDVGSIIGTLNYMCPEQCVRDAVVDTRCDVYALGVVLYELLCGQLPHDLNHVPLPEALRIIQQERPRPLREIRGDISDDLELIVSTAIAKDASRRYASVAAFSDDLRRWLSDRPVAARPPSVLYQTRLFARRHRVPVVASALLLLAIVAGSVASVTFAVREHREAERRLLAEQVAIRERNLALQNAYVATMSAGFAALSAGEMQELRTHLSAAPEALRGWEWNLLARMSQRSLQALKAHDDQIFALAKSRDGTKLATGSRDGRLRVWSATDLALLLDIETPQRSSVFSASFDPSGTRVAVGLADGTVQLIDVDGGASNSVTLHDRRVMHVQWIDASRIASATLRECVVWDVGTHQVLKRLPAAGATVSRDGTRLVTWDQAGVIVVHAASSLQPLRSVTFGEGLASVSISDDGRLLAGGAEPGRVLVWDLSDDADPVEHRVGGTHSLVRHLAFSRDGTQLVVSLGSDRTVQIIPLSSGASGERLHGHEDAVVGAWFSDDQSLVFSASWDGSIRVWGVTPETRGDVVRRIVHSSDDSLRERQVLATAFHPAGRLIATGGRDNHIRLFHIDDGTPLSVLIGHTGDVADLAFASDGTLASASYDGTVRLWDVDTRQSRILSDHAGDVWAVAFSPDGRLLATGGEDRVIRVWNVADGTLKLRLEPHGQRVNDVAFSPDGRLLVSGSRDGSVRLWDIGSGRMIRQLDGHTLDVFAVTFCNAGTTVYSGSRDQTIRVWDVAQGTAIATITGHGQIITSLSPHPGGTRLVAGSWTGQVLICDTASRRIVTTLRQGLGVIRSVRFSPDGRYLCVAGYEGVATLFDSAPPPPDR